MRINAMFEGGAVGQRKMISVSTQTPRSWLRDVQVVESLKIKPLNVEKDGCTDTPLLPPLLASEQVEPKSSSHSGSEIHLPHIVPHTESGESEGESYEELTAPLSMSQLADVNFFDNSDDSLEEDDQSEKPEVNESPPYPDICSSQLSWPVILQYLRESESLASQYFSLDRKSLDIQQEVRGVNNESGRRECEEHSTAIPVIERMGSICEFCGRPSPQWSVLKSINKPPPEACCSQFKEYCLLVAACLKQLIATRASECPTKMSFHKKKATVKLTAEERAFSMIERRKRWEELQKRRKQRKLQNSSSYLLTHQPKTIHFSLMPSDVQNAGWLVAMKEKKTITENHEQDLEEKPQRKKETRMRALSKNALAVLKKSAVSPGPLEVRYYPTGGALFSITLPDRTGQCYYPSGNLAVLITSTLPGVANYLLFNDSEEGSSGNEMLCFADELGSAYCYDINGKLRLQLTNAGGMQHSQKGEGEAKTWQWNSSSATPFQPILLSLNRHLTLHCKGQGQVEINFFVNQQRIKFNISNKLDHISRPQNCEIYNAGLLDAYQQHLSHVQYRMGHLLAMLDHRRSHRLSELGAVFSSKSRPRPRSRSTGTILPLPQHRLATATEYGRHFI